MLFLCSNAVVSAEEKLCSYAEYFQLYQDADRPEQEIFIKACDYDKIISNNKNQISVSDYQNKKNSLVWNAPDGSISYSVNVPKSGVYCLNFSYFPIPSNTTAIEFSILIDGQIPYDTASRATLNKIYVNHGEIQTDAKGSQIRPSQVQQGLWLNTPLMDVDGLTDTPLLFYLEKGKHEIMFDIVKGWFALEYFKFYTPAPVPDYTAYQNSPFSSSQRREISLSVRILLPPEDL